MVRMPSTPSVDIRLKRSPFPNSLCHRRAINPFFGLHYSAHLAWPMICPALPTAPPRDVLAGRLENRIEDRESPVHELGQRRGRQQQEYTISLAPCRRPTCPLDPRYRSLQRRPLLQRCTQRSALGLLLDAPFCLTEALHKKHPIRQPGLPRVVPVPLAARVGLRNDHQVRTLDCIRSGAFMDVLMCLPSSGPVRLWYGLCFG